ncbi:hypothetical protein FXO38_10490 [Capsicum annuum]|nr:hypothetical protein FXO38_10490 [Capsicum annuum]
MIVRSLDINKDPFQPHENNEELVGAEVPYLSAIGALIYLRGTIDMGQFYSNESDSQLIADAGYLSDPHKGRSQTDGDEHSIIKYNSKKPHQIMEGLKKLAMFFTICLMIIVVAFGNIAEGVEAPSPSPSMENDGTTLFVPLLMAAIASMATFFF